MADVVLVAPVFDLPTTISYQYVEELKELLDRYGASYTHLTVLKATQLPLRLAIGDARMVIYAGHAFEDSLVGQFIFSIPYISPLVDSRNSSFLRDLIVIAIPACLNGQMLGPQAIENGVKTWFGSTTYMYAAFPEPEHDYLQDFKDHWRTIPEELLKGVRTGEAYLKYQQKGQALRELYQSKMAEWGNADDYLFTLGENTDRLELFGSPDAIFW